jgi:LmbE family N-acetylglucosaminyl deacetylase
VTRADSPVAVRGVRTAPAPALAATLGALFAATAIAMAQPSPTPSPTAPPPAAPREAGAQAILRDLRRFGEFGSVLYVAAHPDDENTQLITYLALGRHYRTAYLSLTRGDGGQNVIGPEFGDKLGVIRTEELLAARRLDGGRQFFSRARDFGYSKDYQATLTKWDHQGVLSDIVRVIRTFRPDVLVTRFPPEPSATHGHHTASAALALEAFRLAGDPKAFPDQLAILSPWQPRRIFWNAYGPNFGAEVPAGAFETGIDGTDPVTGQPFAVLAARSRSMHRTQGFANFSVAAAGSGHRSEAFLLLAGDPASKDIMEGIDTTWSRVPGGAEVGRLADEAIAAFDPSSPESSVPALLAIKARVAALASDPLVAEKRRLLDRILATCLGLSVETRVERPDAVPGEVLKMHHTASLQSAVPVRWVAVRFPGVGRESKQTIELKAGGRASRDTSRTLPTDLPLSGPYWLREEGTPGMFRVDTASLIGLPESPPSVPIEEVFDVGGQTLVLDDQPVFVQLGAPGPAGGILPPAGGATLPLQIVPPVSLGFVSGVQLFPPGGTRDVVVELTSSRPGVNGSLSLDLPAGWRSVPAAQAFALGRAGDRMRATFAVTGPAAPAEASITARAAVKGVSYDTQRIEIRYAHIPLQVLQPPARMRAVCLDLAIRGRTVGYLPGAGDSVADSLAQMGYAVTALTEADLTPEHLKAFDAVVIGVRAFNTRTDLAPRLPALWGYVEGGGTVVEQYTTPGGIKTPQLGPYEFKISRELPRFRVTDEKAPVTLLVPDHPALTGPNKIGPADFEGWVQERGLDFASEWDAAHYTPLLALSDSGEPPLKGGLLVARYGSGYFVYTGLSFFRQLPAGVPGAYRLFANLTSLGR